MAKYKYRTWIELSESAIKNNYKIFRRIASSTPIMAVVKSNAYGHGLTHLSKTLDKLGVNWFGVDSITEADTLRKNGIIKPILVMGYTIPANFVFAKQDHLSLTISTIESLKKVPKGLKIHIKYDSGMHRQGFNFKQLDEVIRITKKRGLSVEGIYTHFAEAKDPKHLTSTKKQLSNFLIAVVKVKKEFPNILVHAAATSATLNFPKSKLDIVRVGAGLYGFWPSEETKRVWKNRIKLKPVLNWKTIIGEIKKVAKDESVGYNFTEKLKRNSILALLPIGFWHGYARGLSRKAYVLVNGKRAKVIGNVSMDITAIDITDIKGVKVGDEVVLIGKQGNEKILPDELANILGTTSYEVLSRINPLIWKKYTK